MTIDEKLEQRIQTLIQLRDTYGDDDDWRAMDETDCELRRLYELQETDCEDDIPY